MSDERLGRIRNYMMEEMLLSPTEVNQLTDAQIADACIDFIDTCIRRERVEFTRILVAASVWDVVCILFDKIRDSCPLPVGRECSPACGSIQNNLPAIQK